MDPSYELYNLHYIWRDTYELAWKEWQHLGCPGIFKDWTIKTYGTEFSISMQLISNVAVKDSKLHHFMLLKHGNFSTMLEYTID